MSRIVVDTVVLAAIVDTGDKWHQTANALRERIEGTSAELFLLDVVISETFSVLARRLHEQRRVSQIDEVFARLEKFAPPQRITWLSARIERLYPEILALIHQYRGELNFNDALIALSCRELAIPYIASFDRDFDRVGWLTRIDTPANVPHT